MQGHLCDPFLWHCWVCSVGRALQNLVSLGRARPELQLEWGWNGVGISVPQVSEQCQWPKNKCKPKCCAVISTWTWKNTKAFLFSDISVPVIWFCFAPLLEFCYQGRRKAISSVHSDFILIQLLYWLQSWRRLQTLFHQLLTLFL